FQNIALRKITNAPPFVSNLTLHNDLRKTTVLDEAKCYYKRFHTKLPLHPNPLIKKLSTLSIPGNPPRRLKRRCITSRNNAPISNYGGGFRCKSEYPRCIIEPSMISVFSVKRSKKAILKRKTNKC
ncbi:Uncharacterized protein FWK35_00036816, partial [Aphis craccivora]